MEMHNLTKIFGNRRSKKRIGRGGGSGKGFHTVGKGHKGQNSRSGHGIPVGFEGGQVPLYKKLPKRRGFKRDYKIKPAVINLSQLEIFKDGSTITVQALVENNIISVVDAKKGVKILGKGDTEKKLNFSGISFSEKAKERILSLGGTV